MTLRLYAREIHSRLYIICDTPVSKLADHKLYTTENESLLRTAAMSSCISQLNIIDILYTALGTMNYDETIKVLHRTYIEKPKN